MSDAFDDPAIGRAASPGHGFAFSRDHGEEPLPMKLPTCAEKAVLAESGETLARQIAQFCATGTIAIDIRGNA